MLLPLWAWCKRSHDQQCSLTPELPWVGGGVKPTLSAIHFTCFLSPCPDPHHFVMTFTAMTKILKLKEVDMSPGDAEATPTQVCRAGLYPACFANSFENNVGVKCWCFCGEDGSGIICFYVILTCPHFLPRSPHQQPLGASELAPSQVHTLFWPVNHSLCPCWLVCWFGSLSWGEVARAWWHRVWISQTRRIQSGLNLNISASH